MVDPQTDIALVGADVVNSKGDELAQFRILEVVSVDLDRLALGPIVAAAILEFADQLFLLRVDGNHGLIGGLERFHLGVDIFELGVAIGMAAPLLGLAVEMATIFQLRQKFGNARGIHFVTHPPKRRRQLLMALGDPSQRSHRITHRRGLEQSLKVFQKSRVLGRQPEDCPARAAYLPGQRSGIAQVFQTASDRTSRDLRRARGRRDPAITRRLRLRRGGQTSTSLIQRGTNGFIPNANG